MRSGDQAAPLLANLDGARLECILQHRQRFVRIAGAAHEDVDRGEVTLRPGVDRDMTLGQYQHARYTAVGSEMMEMTVQYGCTRRLGRLTQREVDRRRIGEVAG